MGNEEGKMNFSSVDCKIDSVYQPFETNLHHPQEIKSLKTNLRTRKGIKKLTNTNTQFGNDNKQMITKSIGLFKETQEKQTQNTQMNAQSKMLKKMEKAFRFLKGLKVLQQFQQKYEREYPILILNKDASIKKMRQEIIRQKHKHTYFHIDKDCSHQQILQKQSDNMNKKTNNLNLKQVQRQQKVIFQEQQKEDEIYFHFQVIERIEWLIIRLYQTARHLNVLKQLKQLDMRLPLKFNNRDLKVINQFVQQVYDLDIQLMDMLFYQLNQNQFKYSSLVMGDNFPKEEAPCYHPQVEVISVKGIIMQEKQHKIKSKTISTKIIQNNKIHDNIINEYSSCKQLGWQIYKKNKVCFYLLALDNKPFMSQLQPLNIPNNYCLLQILLQKYDAFAELLQLNYMDIYIIIDSKRTPRLKEIIQKNQQKWSRLNLKIMKSQQLPCLDIQGNFILNHETNEITKKKDGHNQYPQNIETNCVKMASIGSYDLWSCIEENLNDMQKYQYIEVIETGNCLQEGFDCFLVGKSRFHSLLWATKVYQPIIQSSSSQLSFIKYGNERNKQKVRQQTYSNKYQQIKEELIMFIPQLQIIHPSQVDYDKKATSMMRQKSSTQSNHFVYGGHTLIDMKLVKKIISNNHQKQNLKFRKKILKQKENNFLVFERHQIDVPIEYLHRNSYYFNEQQTGNQSDMRGSTRLKQQEKSKRWAFFQYERNESFYPFYFRQNGGVFDIEGCSRALSMSNLSKLDLSVNKYLINDRQKSIKCYIDPHVSLDGDQLLEEVVLEIERKINEILMLSGDNDNNSANMSTLQTDGNQMTCSKVVSSISQISIISEINSNQQRSIRIFVN